MAHPIHIKARAMADLLLGEPAADVARALHIPERTIRRWRGEAWAMARASLSAEAREEVAELRAIWPGLSRTKGPMQRGQTVARCNAKTRSGGLCQSFPVRSSKRCRMHGGGCKGCVHPSQRVL